jgi:hypothetical protein
MGSALEIGHFTWYKYRGGIASPFQKAAQNPAGILSWDTGWIGLEISFFILPL